MSLGVFQVACVVVVLVTLAMLFRLHGTKVLRDYVAIALGALIGEDTCVAIYRFYAYSEGWSLRIHHVPVLVPLIWPLVILSARDVAKAISGAKTAAHVAIGTAIVVAFDASLVEVLSVRASLWSWVESGLLGVPLIGILGWSYFALGVTYALEKKHRSLAPLAGVAAAHGLIVLTWWGCFRWILRGDLGRWAQFGFGVFAFTLLVFVVRARRSGLAMTFSTAMPRLAATGLFFVLFLQTAPRDAGLWTHFLCVAVPYFASWNLVPIHPLAPRIRSS